MRLIFAVIVISIPLIFLRLRPQLPNVPKPPVHEVSTREQCYCDSGSTENYIVKLHRPWHHFDSNHWFHICEYYLSRHRFVDSHVPDNSTLLIVADDVGFTAGMTEMTMFYMMLAFTQGTAKEVKVYDPVYISQGVKGLGNFVYDGPIYSYTRDADLSNRYSLVGAKHVHRHSSAGKCMCGSYVGEFGAAPIDRGYWFSGSKDVKIVREKISALCPAAEAPLLLRTYSHVLVPYSPNPGMSQFSDNSSSPQNRYTSTANSLRMRKDNHTTSAVGTRPAAALRGRLRSSRGALSRRLPASPTEPSKSKPMFKMVIYQRDADRKFLKLDHILSLLHRALGTSWSLEVLNHEEKLDPCLLSAVLKDADIYLTTHGFQSMGILFMKKGSVIMEVFPYKYWKVGYKPLADEFGVHHRWVQNNAPVSSSRNILLAFPQEFCMWSLWCRDFSRGDDVIMTPDMMDSLLHTARDLEAGIIGAHNAPAVFGVK